jgi:hypothetical protein
MLGDDRPFSLSLSLSLSCLTWFLRLALMLLFLLLLLSSSCVCASVSKNSVNVIFAFVPGPEGSHFSTASWLGDGLIMAERMFWTWTRAQRREGKAAGRTLTTRSIDADTSTAGAQVAERSDGWRPLLLLADQFKTDEATCADHALTVQLRKSAKRDGQLTEGCSIHSYTLLLLVPSSSIKD